MKMDAEAFWAGVSPGPSVVPERRRWPPPASESLTNGRVTVHVGGALSTEKNWHVGMLACGRVDAYAGRGMHHCIIYT